MDQTMAQIGSFNINIVCRSIVSLHYCKHEERKLINNQDLTVDEGLELTTRLDAQQS